MVGSLFPALFEGFAEALEAPAEGRVLDEGLLADGELEAPPGSLEEEKPRVFVVVGAVPELAFDDRPPEVEGLADLSVGGERLGADVARLGVVGVERVGLAGEVEGGEDGVVELRARTRLAGLDQRSPYHCWDVLEHSAVAAECVLPDRITRWAALLHDAGKPACFTVDGAGQGHFYGHAKPGAEIARAALTRLKFDRDTVNRVSRLVELHDYPMDPPNDSPERAVKKLIGKLGEEDFFRLLELKRADALAHHPDYRGRAAACDRIGALARELLARKAVFSLKDLAVNGRDLLDLGFPRGPMIGQSLNALLEAVLSGTLPNERETLLEAARKEFQKAGATDYGNTSQA